MPLTHLFRRLFARALTPRKTPPIRRAARPLSRAFEHLEDRSVPAVLYWQGDVDALWATPGNWAADPAGTPTAATPTNGDSLVFDTNTVGFTAFTSTNNSGGISLAGVQIVDASAAGNFNIDVNIITLTGNLTSNVTAGGDVIIHGSGDAITLGASAAFISTAGQLAIFPNVALNGHGLTVDGAATTGLGGTVTGAGSLTMNGTGFLLLAGTSDYTGPTTLNAGVTALDNATGLGAAGAGNETTVNTGASLVLRGAGTPVAEALTLNGSGPSGFGALDNIDNDNTVSGAITLGSTAVIGAGGGTTLTLSGTIDDGPGTFGVTKVRAGTVRYSGTAANTYTGTTAVNEGTLELSKTGVNAVSGPLTVGNGIGTDTVRLLAGDQIADTVDVTIASGGVFDLNGNSETIDALAGSGTVTSGAAGAVTLTVGAGNGGGTFGGVIQNGSGTVSLTKSGTGTQTLSGANTYTGLTTVSAGTLAVTSATGLGTTAAGTTVAAGATLDVRANIGAEPITVGGTGVGGNGALITSTGTGVVGGPVNLTANTALGGAGALTISGAIGGAFGVTKVGTGTTTLTGTNTYTGATLITAGRLNVNGSITSDVTVTAPGVLGGTGTINGDVTGTGTVAPGLTPGILTINGNFTPTGTVEFEVNPPATVAGTHYDQIIVSGDVDLSGATLSFLGTNSPPPVAQNQVVTLILNNGPNPTVPAPGSPQGSTVVIGNNTYRLFYTGGNGNELVLVEASAPPATVYVDDSFTQSPGQPVADADLGTAGNQPAVFGVTAFTTINQALAAVAPGGTVVVNSGTYAEAVSLGGTTVLRVTGPAAPGTVTISSLATAAGTTVQLDSTSLLTIGDATNTTIAGAITQGSGAGGRLTKQGIGTLTLSGANTYTGLTTVSAGTLAVTSATGLGTTAAGTTVAAGATLDVRANIGAEPITVGGTGVGGNGALITSTGTGTVGGPVTLTADTSIGGAGALTIGGAIGGALGVTKVGAGTTTLNGTNTYTGTTTVNAGTLLVNGTNTGTGAVSVNNDATLGGTGSLAGAVTVNGTAQVAPGLNAGPDTTDTLETGSVTFTAGTSFDVEIGGTGAGQFDQLDVTGAVALGGATLNLFQAGGFVPSNATQQTFRIIDNNGADAVTGTFAGLPEGSPAGTVGGVTLFITYRGGNGNDVELNTQPVVNGTPGDDTLVLRRLSATQNEFSLNGGPFVPVSSAVPFTFDGLGGTDLLYVDTANGDPIPAGGVTFVGELLRVERVGGTATDTVVLAPGAVAGTGTLSITGFGDIAYTGVTEVDLVNLAAAILQTGSANDTLTVEDDNTETNGGPVPVGYSLAPLPVLQVGGGAGTLLPQVGLRQVGAATVNTPTAVDGDDAVTIAGGTGAHGVTDLTVVTGDGADTVTVTGSLTVGGDITILSQNIAFSGGTLTAGGTGLTNTIVLDAGTGASTTSSGALDVFAQILSATAEDGIDLDTRVGFVTAASTVAGAIRIDEFDGIELTSVTTANGAIDVTAGGTIQVGDVSAVGNTVTLTAGGAIEEVNTVASPADAAADITALNTSLTAATGIGAAGAIETAVTNLAATTGTGGVFLANTGDLTVTTVGAVAGVTVTGASGNIAVSATGLLNVNQVVSGPGTVDLTAGTDLNANAAVSSTGGGNVTLTAGGDVVVNANVSTTGPGVITLTAGDDIRHTTGTISTTGAGFVRFTAGGGITQTGGTLTAPAAVFRSGEAVDYASPTNDVDTLAAVVTVADQDFEYRDADDLVIGTVDGVNGISTNDGNPATPDGDVTVCLVTGNLTVTQNITAGTGTVRLQTLGAAGSVSGAGSVTGVALGVRAGTGGVALDNPANDVDTFAATTTGTLTFRDTDGFTIGTVGAQGCFTPGVVGVTATDVEMCADTGDIVIAAPIVATGTVRLQATAGSVTENAANPAATITAATLGVRAGGGSAALDNANDVDTFAAVATGALSFRDVDGFAIGTVTAQGCFTPGVTGVTAGTDLVLCVDTGDLTINAPIAAATVRLQATTGSVTETGTATITAGTLGVRAGGGNVALGNANDADTFAAVATGAVTFRDVDGVTVGTVGALGCFTPGVTGVSGTDVEICVDTGNLTIAAPITATGTVRLEATAGSVTESGTATITANALGVRAGGGVVTLNNSNDVNVLAAFAAGNVGVVNQNGVDINAVAAGLCFTATTGVTTADGDVSVANNVSGNITVSQAVTAGTSGVGVGAVNSVVLDANSPAADLTVNAAVTSDRGPITLTADDDVTFGAAGDVSSNGGNVTITADADGSGAGAVTMDQGTAVNAGSGLITVSAAGNVTLGDLTTTNATAAAVSVISTAGGIFDAGSDADAEITANAAGAVVTLSAATGIGPADAIETQVATLRATNAASGNIRIAEADAITLESVVQTTAAAGNDIFVTAATGDITVGTVNNPGNTAGDVYLTATAGSILDDNINATRITGRVLTLQATNLIGAPPVNAVEDLDTDAVFLDAVAANGIWVTDAGAVTVTRAVTTAGVVVLDAATGLVARTVTAGGGQSVRLRTTVSGDVRLGQVAGDVVTAAGGTVLIQVAGSVADGNGDGVNVVAQALAATAGGSVGAAGDEIETDVALLAATAGTGGVFVEDASGLTVTAVTAFGTTTTGITAATDIGICAETGGIAIDARVSAGGTVRLQATAGSVGETANPAATITAARLGVRAGGGNVILENDNDVDTFAAAATGAVSYRDVDEVSIGSVAALGCFNPGVTGVSGGTNVELCVETGDLTITAPIVAADTVRLQADAGSVTETGTGTITANALGVGAGGAVTLNNSNDVNTLAGFATGNVSVVNANGVTIGTVAAGSCFTGAAGVTSTGGNVSITNNAGGGITVAEAVTASAGSVSLTTTGAGSPITVNAPVTAATSITATAAGAITQSGDGLFAAPTLTTTSAGGQALLGANAVSTFTATNAGGDVSLNNTVPLTIAGVTQQAGGNIGVTNAGAVTVTGAVTTPAGNIVLTANGGAMTIGGGVATDNGTVALTTTGTGPLEVNAPVSATDGVTADIAGAVTVNAPVTTAAGQILIMTRGDFTTRATSEVLLDAGSGTILVFPRTPADPNSTGPVTTVALLSEVRGAAAQFGQPASDPAANLGRDAFIVRPSRSVDIRVFGNQPSVAPGDSIFPFVTGTSFAAGLRASSVQLTVTGRTGDSIQGFYTVTFEDGTRRRIVFEEIESFGQLGFRAMVVQTGLTTYAVRVTAFQGEQPVNASLEGQGLPPNPFVVSPQFISPDARFSPPSVTFGDVTGDGNPDMILANGANDVPLVTVVDGVTLAGQRVRLDQLTPTTGLVAQFYAYDPVFRGGLSVAAADFNGDGRAEIVTGAGNGGGARVRMFEVRDNWEALGLADRVDFSPPGLPLVAVNGGLSSMANFFPFDPSFRGGVNVATGDINGDGRADLIIGAGVGGGPRVMVFSGQDGGLLHNFFAYGEGLRGGVLVAGGDADGDGRDDILTGPGLGGAPHIQVFRFTSGRPELIASFYAFGFDSTARRPGSIQASDPDGTAGVGAVAFGTRVQGTQQQILVSTARGPRLQVRGYTLQPVTPGSTAWYVPGPAEDLYGSLTAFVIVDPITGRPLAEFELSDGATVGGIATDPTGQGS